MVHKVIPFSEEEKLELTQFERLVIDYIERNGNQNVPDVDRYNPGRVSNLGAAATRYSSDGRVEFGSLWAVNRASIADKELVVAHIPRTRSRLDEADKFLASLSEDRKDDSEIKEETHDISMPSRPQVIVNEFSPLGLASRTTFVEAGKRVYKSRVTNFVALRGLGFAELDRRTSATEESALEHVLCLDIEDAEAALNALVKLTIRDERSIRKARQEHDKREKEHRKQLEAIDRARIRLY